MAKTKKKANALADVASQLVTQMNKQFKHKTPSQLVRVMSDPDSALKISGWVSTGCGVLDVAISNLHAGGFPVGRICGIKAPEQAGKSTLAAHAIADTQAKGGS